MFANIFAANQILLNDGSGNFVDISSVVGIPQLLEEDSYGISVADYDNDGDPDLYFTNGGFNTAEVNRLYRNDGNVLGVFTDIGADAGVEGPIASNHASAWLDYDNDGLLDLAAHRRGAPSSLYRNQGDGTFFDVAPLLGLDVDYGANGVCAADFDNDGYVDIFFPRFPLPGQSAVSQFFRNNGDGTFTGFNIGTPWRAFTCAAEDFDQDGWIDLYVATFNMAGDPNQEPSVLYRNLNGTDFENVAVEAGVGLAANIMGLQTGDLNNDGYPDIFIGTGDPNVVGEDVVYLNRTDPEDGEIVFEDVSSASGIRALPPLRTHGTSFADFDVDGDLDMFVGMGGNMPTGTCGCPEQGELGECLCPIPGQEEPNRFWLNTSNLTAGWVRYRLLGVVSNRDAIGARMRIHAGTRTFYRHVSGGNGFNSRNAFEQIAGIGSEAQIDQVEISWPSGIVQVVDAPVMATGHVWTEVGIVGPTGVVPGGTVELQVAGPPGAAFRLYSSPTKVDSSARAGTRLLGPILALLASGSTPPDGIPATLSIAVPPDLALGQSVYVQARVKVFGTWYITNMLEMLVQTPGS